MQLPEGKFLMIAEVYYERQAPKDSLKLRLCAATCAPQFVMVVKIACFQRPHGGPPRLQLCIALFSMAVQTCCRTVLFKQPLATLVYLHRQVPSSNLSYIAPLDLWEYFQPTLLQYWSHILHCLTRKGSWWRAHHAL